MRHLVAVCLLAALTGSPSPAAGQFAPSIRVYITDGGALGSVPVWTTPRYVEGPDAFIAPVRPKPQSGSPPELMFGIGAWKEGDAARVIVYAMLLDTRAPKGRTNTPISTFLITPKQSLEVKEARAWGVLGLVVSADVQ
jgi:hypothetical protein